MSALEVWVEGEEAASWLRARGFRPGVGGVWLRPVAHAEKMKLVEELVRELGGRVRNLNVRDLERVDVSAGRGGARA
jgi:hypothetical protein